MGKFSTFTKVALLTAAAGIYAGSGTSARAGFIWDMSTPTGDQGTSHSYSDTTSTYSITAYGYSTHNAPSSIVLGSTWTTGGSTATDLYGKVTSGDPSETGLGLARLDTADHEIQPKSFVQLDLLNVKNAGLSHFTMSVGSIQTGEGYYVWGSSTLGAPGKLLRISALGGNTDTFTISDSDFSTYRYFSVSASKPAPYGDSDVLIMNGLSAVPEPSTMLVGALVLLPFGASTVRCLRSRKS